MTDAVQTHLDISLDAIKQHLRIDDELEINLKATSLANSFSHVLESVDGLRVKNYITLAGVDAQITYINTIDRTVALDRVVSPLPLTAGTVLTFHSQNALLLDYAEAAKSVADTFLNNPFLKPHVNPLSGEVNLITVIPSQVRHWVLNQIGLYYLHPENSVSSRSQRESGNVQFGHDQFAGIELYRLMVLG